MKVHMQTPRKPGNVCNACHMQARRGPYRAQTLTENKIVAKPAPDGFATVSSLYALTTYMYVDRDGYSCFCCFVLFQETHAHAVSRY